MSTPLKDLIEKHCGGVGGWDNLLAIHSRGLICLPVLPIGI